MGVSSQRGEVEALIRLVGEDQVSKMVADVQRKIAGTAEKTRQNVTETQNWKTALGGARDSWAMLATGMNSALGLARAVVSAGTMAFDVWEESAKERGVELAFERAAIRAGWAADAAERLSEAVHGTVEGTELAKIGSQAIRAGVSLEQLEGLLDVARGAARETGEDVEAVARKMVDAVAKGSIRSLRELLPDLAASMGDVGDGLEGVEQRQVALNLILDQGAERFAGVGDSAADSAARARTAWDTFTDAMAEGLTGGGQERFAARLEAQFDPVIAAEKRLALARERIGEDMYKATRAEVERVAALMDVERADTAATEATRAREQALVDVVVAESAANNEKAVALLRTSELLRETGFAAEAERTFAESQRLMGFAVADATVPLQEQIDVLVRSKAAAIDAALSLAALAAAQGQSAIAVEQWTRAAGLMGGAKPRRGGGGGGARAKEDPGMSMGQLIGSMEGERFRADDEGSDGRSETRARQAEEMRAHWEEQRAIGVEAMAALDAQAASLADSLRGMDRASFDAASSFAASFGGAAEAVANSSQIIVEELGRVRDVLAQSEKAGLSMTEGFAKAAPGMLAASGKLAGGLMGDKRAEAGVNAAFEGAAAIASFASLDFWGGAMHTAAAIQYGLVAGGAIGGGGGRGAGGGRGKARPASVGPAPAERQERATIVTTINMRGSLVTQEGSRELDRMISRERGSRSSEFAMG